MTNRERGLRAVCAAVIAMMATAPLPAIAAGGDAPAASASASAMPDPDSPTFMTTRAQILWVQKALARSGQALSADGYWGCGTTRALRGFQKAQHLRVTGYPDRMTLEALARFR